MLELVSTVESLNSTVMSAMTPRTPSPLTEEPPSADKVEQLTENLILENRFQNPKGVVA
jgi:hypothetical protein